MLQVSGSTKQQKVMQKKSKRKKKTIKKSNKIISQIVQKQVFFYNERTSSRGWKKNAILQFAKLGTYNIVL